MKKELHLLIILVQSGLMILNDACKAAQIIRWVEICFFSGLLSQKLAQATSLSNKQIIMHH